MCCRFALNHALGQLRRNINARAINTNGRTFTPSNNIRPNQTAPVVTNNEIQLMSFGANVGPRFQVNARSENITGTWKDYVHKRRCIVPADGYFEWNSKKQPYFFHNSSSELMFFAGIYTDDGHFIIITREATKDISSVHLRMPLIMTFEQSKFWDSDNWRVVLNQNVPIISFYMVSNLALREGYTGEDCIKPLTDKSPIKGQKKIDALFAPKKKQEIAAFLGIAKV